jgi:hypothetical protein
MFGMLLWTRIALAATPADPENVVLDGWLFPLCGHTDETTWADTIEVPVVDPDDRDGDGVRGIDDCDDLDPDRFPGAPERCDGRDDDCDLEIDEDLPTAPWFVDADGDSYGSDLPRFTCDGPPIGYVGNHADCDDIRAAVHPGATEIPDNGLDDDCNRFTADDDEST